MTALTPATLTDLRLSCRTLRGLGGGVALPFPYLLYLPADDLFCLHAYGSPQCSHASADLLGTLMRAERHEPGYIRRLLDPATDPTVALLDPTAFAARVSRNAEIKAQLLAEAADRTEAARRRANQIDPTRIGLEDL